MQIITWLVAAMFAWTPAKEPDRARYTEIASDLAAVVYDPAEQPLFAGSDGRAKTALLLASIAAHESTFRVDVENGRARGDGGTSWCFMQLHIGSGKTVEGWTGQDVTSDRKLCFRAGLHIARESFRMCNGLPDNEMLSAYASGQCGRSLESRVMVSRATAYSQHHPMNDAHYTFVENNSTQVMTKRDSTRDAITRRD
ncbi:MAG: hypothetical protein ACLQBL_14880 [Polyangiaceae bacterium]|jgi:hypothetical protein